MLKNTTSHIENLAKKMISKIASILEIDIKFAFITIIQTSEALILQDEGYYVCIVNSDSILTLATIMLSSMPDGLSKSI